MTRGYPHFSPEKDVPSLTGRVCLVTGGNSGLGYQTVLQLAQHNPSEIYLTARSASKAKEAINNIQAIVPNSRITFLQLDLDNLESVRTAAKTVLSSSHRLDLLFLNAGIMCFPPGTTKDGYEVQFGTNHMAHALLVRLLLPILQKAEDPRVVILTSDMWSQAPAEGVRFDAVQGTQEDLSTWQRYGQSKLANILYGVALARRCPEIKVASVHPGIYRTGLQTAMAESNAAIKVARKLFGGLLMGDPAKGTRNQLWAATSMEVRSGEYYTPVGVPGKARKFMDDRALVDRLWDWTERELEGYKIEDLD